MNYQLIVLLMASFFCLSANSHAQAHVLTWSFDRVAWDIHGNEQRDTITYSVNSTISKIEYQNEIIYIDYGKGTLFRYNKLKQSCVEFPLSSYKTNESPKPLEDPRKRSILLIGSLKVLTTKEHKKVSDYNCSLKHIMFGADLGMYQMIAPLVVHELGHNFTESMISYSVSNEVTDFSNLLAIAQKRNDVFKNNPLLRQIDIVGLLEILGGFPVQTTFKSRDTTSTTTLIDVITLADNYTLLPPDECRD